MRCIPWWMRLSLVVVSERWLGDVLAVIGVWFPALKVFEGV